MAMLTPLQPAEYALLILLAERPGEVVSVNAIADALGISESQPRRDRVKWHIWKLRQAIEDDPKHPKLILTEAGSRLSARKIRIIPIEAAPERGFLFLLQPIVLLRPVRSPQLQSNRSTTLLHLTAEAAS